MTVCMDACCSPVGVSAAVLPVHVCTCVYIKVDEPGEMISRRPACCAAKKFSLNKNGRCACRCDDTSHHPIGITPTQHGKTSHLDLYKTQAWPSLMRDHSIVPGRGPCQSHKAGQAPHFSNHSQHEAFSQRTVENQQAYPAGKEDISLYKLHW